MRRPTLAVDTTVTATSQDEEYKLSQSPSIKHRHSLDSTTAPPPQPQPAPAPTPAYTAPQPTIRLLFHLLSRRDVWLLIAPALCLSVISGGIAPFMTHVVGQTFNSFADFVTTSEAPEQAKKELLHNVGIASLQLLALAAGSLALSSVMSTLWILAGERNVLRLRKTVFEAVTKREMDWFDTKMGDEGAVKNKDGDGPVGAAGLMAKFAKDTDEVRQASSLASGMIIQHVTTCLTCLVLAFQKSWSLTLVILSAVPLLLILQTISQGVAGPLLAEERKGSATSATLVERAISAIATVKAFNAQKQEIASLSKVLEDNKSAAERVHRVWGIASCACQFTTLAMFVQGFWYGSKLVRDGSISAGDVMAVFWACLIATSNLQMSLPHMIVLTRGKWSMVSLVQLINPPPSTDAPATAAPAKTIRQTQSIATLTPLTPSIKRTHSQVLRRIRPTRCLGEFSFNNVTFAYPSRPNEPVLKEITLFLPAEETTFIVGGSGSGKSTVAQLLARMYAPQQGSIQLDDQDIAYLDEEWTRKHVAVVSQACILFDMSVHDNVAIGIAGSDSGRKPEDVTRQEVVDACTAALMHEFVRDLPDGYDTKLGTGGANLSGGQKQRLAIARAKLRDPSVLVLDEATSALDATSRVLVFEAIKAWRRNKATVVITHDLSQIGSNDFVYVLKDGQVSEQGYRYDLEATPRGEFRRMSRSQGEAGGFPVKDLDEVSIIRAGEEIVGRVFEEQQRQQDGDEENVVDARQSFVHVPPSTFMRSDVMAGWMFEVVQDLTRTTTTVLPPPVTAQTQQRSSAFLPSEMFGNERPLVRRMSMDDIASISLPSPPPVYTSPGHYQQHSTQQPKFFHNFDQKSRRYSLPFTPTSPSTFSFTKGDCEAESMAPTAVEDDLEFGVEKAVMERSGNEVNKKRSLGRMKSEKSMRRRWDAHELGLEQVVVDRKAKKSKKVRIEETKSHHQQPVEIEDGSMFKLACEVYKTLPNKFEVFVGVVACVLSGISTPVFSFMLSKLLVEVSNGAKDPKKINVLGAAVLVVTFLQSAILGFKFYTMENAGLHWMTHLRQRCFKIVLGQDKSWFDRSENSPATLTQILIKDGDDARNLISIVLTQFTVVVTLLLVGIIWALIRGWQLTLAGFAIGPIFVLVMGVQSKLMVRIEARNKKAKEDVAKDYFESIQNVRAIRFMSFETVFESRFSHSVEVAYRSGLKGAWVEGCGNGVSSAIVYLAEAVLFYVGAILVANGTYSYLRMVETLNLVVFSVSLGAQMMTFTQRIAKATKATRDFNKLLNTRTDTTDESTGHSLPVIEGDVVFENVSFTYPSRPDVPVLRNANFRLRDGECVALVGASGCGKSTVAALLQRLYEPSSGSIRIGKSVLQDTEIHHLREHVAVVSQNPHLFDASIAENISYGSGSMSKDSHLSFADIRLAAQKANVHDFIMGLPKGYETPVGENAALISGGQAQRIQIARALARPSKILILDECTSALDTENQAAVMETIRDAKVGRTTIMITHKIPVMQMCDRIIVFHDGENGCVAEDGTYDELLRRGAAFAEMVSGGVCQAD